MSISLLHYTTESELEKKLLEYDAEAIDKLPYSEKELMFAYVKYADVLYQYLRVTSGSYLPSLNNELRAVLGHLAEYRISNTLGMKRDLEKAHGHMRRFNLDALKILCDDFDRSLSKILKSQYKYDYRGARLNYLEEFGIKYFNAKNLYIIAQQSESVGSDIAKHNIIALYYEAAKSYILLKQYYQKNKVVVTIAKAKVITKNVFIGVLTVFGISVTVMDMFFRDFLLYILHKF